MEVDLKGVIEKIKEEGVAAADREAAKIIQNAEKKSADIIASANKEKETIMADAAGEAAKLKENSEKAVKQAVRDSEIALRSRLEDLLKEVTREEVSKTMTPDVLKEIIIKLITLCRKEGDFDVEVLLSAEDKKALDEALGTAFKEELKKGVTLKASPSIEKGFRIGEKNKKLYYDFTDDAVSETLNFYLNKKVKGIIGTGE